MFDLPSAAPLRLRQQLRIRGDPGGWELVL
jgi:hypothetical protein